MWTDAVERGRERGAVSVSVVAATLLPVAVERSSMYVSPAVRSIRDDPIDGETVTLLIESEDDADTDALASALAEAGGEVRDRRRFGTLVVAVNHDAVADVCALPGIDVVETDNATTVDPDGAGEDVEYDGDV